MRLRILLAATLAAALLSCRGQRPDGRPAAEAPVPSPTAIVSDGGYSKPYEFSNDWFSPRIPIWSKVLGPLRGKADLRYLEIGMYEGRSLLWVLENVFTHPTSRLTGIDVELKPRLLSNVAKSGHAQRIRMIRGPSQAELRKLPARSFDVVYVDGSHFSADVLSDAVQSFELLKEGGLMIFDDYGWVGAWVGRRGQLLPDQLRPGPAIDAFVRAYRYDVSVVERGYQMIVRRTTNPCRKAGIEEPCSPFGQYLFDWQSERLLVADDPSRRVPISPAETELVESLLKAERPGDESDPGFTALRQRIQLEVPEHP
jgi:predicted O-methyltransferase YrrM